MLLFALHPVRMKLQEAEVATAIKPVKVKCTLSEEKKIKIFISDLMIQACCLDAQKVQIESEKVNKVRSLELS